MCKPLLQFPEGWFGSEKNPFRGGGKDIFWNYTIMIITNDLDKHIHAKTNDRQIQRFGDILAPSWRHCQGKLIKYAISRVTKSSELLICIS